MWPLNRKKPLFTQEENAILVNSIRHAEKQTSGEIRVFVESHCKYVDPLDRAGEIFSSLKMEETELRNGVLFYIAIKDQQLAIYADKGIHDATGQAHWQNEVKAILAIISKENIVNGICTAISKIGQALKQHFPYDAEVDKNELPDEIIFGH
ncbi:MAG: TPM domain-containing protein [Bacteroidetes bacterium]|nr:TPM domain-containing protein [Bacteroidota bacterium]